MECPAQCAAVGDPHYTTFDGFTFSFNGACNYRLVREITTDEFDVTAMNVPCGSTGVTCTKAVEIRAYAKRWQLLHGEEVRENNKTLTATPATHVKDQVHISKAGLFISLTFEFGMTVLWDGGEHI
jgi:hypothetical protein